MAWIRSRYSGRPASEVRPEPEESDSYWKPRTPCATIAHPVGDGFGFANEAYLPDSSGPTGNTNYLGAEFRILPHLLVVFKRPFGRSHADPAGGGYHSCSMQQFVHQPGRKVS